MTRSIEDQRLLLELFDDSGIVRSVLRFGSLGLNKKFAAGLRRAMIAELGHQSLESQRQQFRCIKKFAVFLNETHFNDCESLPPDVLFQFSHWLTHTKLKASTRATIQVSVVRLISWCQRHSIVTIGKNIELRLPTIERNEPKAHKQLSRGQINHLFELCQAEIESIEATIADGIDLLERIQSDPARNKLRELLLTLLDRGGNLLPTQRAMGTTFTGRVSRAGGLRKLRSLLWLTPDSMFPFYLALVIETAGNPMALLEMRRDCIQKSGLHGDLERVIWGKRRSNAEQSTEYVHSGAWSAAGLVRRLIKVNENLVVVADVRQRERLFLCLTPSGSAARILCFQAIHQHLGAFTSKHRLDHFTFMDIRASLATEDIRDGKPLSDVKRKLNHKNVKTTIRYVEAGLLNSLHQAQIYAYQGEIVRLAQRRMVILPTIKASDPTNAEMTVFGFGCKNPLAGIQPDSPVGELCKYFSRCATCPGAVVVVDDVAVIARLLAVQGHLAREEERSVREGWSRRFAEVYGPTLKILANSILPHVALEVIEAARRLPTVAIRLNLE